MSFLPDRPAPASGFIREALTLAGAEWDEPADGILEILMPGEPELRRATFEPEIAREETGVELLGTGSPLAEALARRGLDGGRLARAWISPPPVPPPPPASAFDLRAKRVDRSEWTDRLGTTWIFAFWTRALGEFRSDALHLCALDGASLRQVRRFQEIFAACRLEDVGPAPSGDAPFENAYRAAREEILGRAAAFFRKAEGESERELAKETDRTRAYYEGLIAEMNDDMERVGAQDPRRTSILSRMQATRADRDRALAQAVERSRLRMEVEALGALGVTYPRPTATLTLADAAGRLTSVQAAWDPVFGQFEPLVCPACGRPTYRLEARPRGATCGCA